MENTKWLTSFSTDTLDGTGDEEWISFAKKLPGVVKFIETEADVAKPRGILVVSRRGKCRSCLFLVAFMLLKKKMPLKEALTIAQEKRPCMKMHERFSIGMDELDEALQKRYLEIKRMESYDFLNTQVTPLFN